MGSSASGGCPCTKACAYAYACAWAYACAYACACACALICGAFPVFIIRCASKSKTESGGSVNLCGVAPANSRPRSTQSFNVFS